MTDPSVLLGEFQSLATTPQAVNSGSSLFITSIYAANVNADTPYWLHLLQSDGTTRRWSMLVPPNNSGFIFSHPTGVAVDGLKVATSTAKDSVTGSPGTDVDVVLFGRGRP